VEVVTRMKKKDERYLDLDGSRRAMRIDKILETL
jgi:hypothetical protein